MNIESTEKPQVLIVDDSKVIRRAAIKMLSDDYQVHEAVDGLDGWQQLQRNDSISVVFTDMQMPEMNGVELLAKIRNSDDERLSALPVIMITGADDTEEAKRRVYESGATDFITKPFQSIDLLSRARSYACLNRKVVELEQKTGHDKLTGLFSQAGFDEQADKAFAFAVRHGLQLTTVNLEIESFDDIFLAHGKSIAQQIIVAVGKHLKEMMRTEDVAAYLGVANYALLLPLTNDSSARVVVSRICESINKLVFSTRDEKIHIALAAGYAAIGKNPPDDFSAMRAQADTALKQALKSTTGNKVVCFLEQALPERKPDFTDKDMADAFQHILDGAYSRVPENMLQAVAEKFTPFLDYVANRSDTGMTGTDNS